MTRGKYIVFLLLGLVMVGCRPRGVLSTSKMREVLFDLHKTEAILQQCGYNYGHDEAVAKYYYVVLEKHGVTKAQFDSSLVWYTDHPDFGNILYPRVVSRVEAEVEELEHRVELRNAANGEPVGETVPTASVDVPDLDVLLEEYRKGLWPKIWDFYPETDINPPFSEKNNEK